MSQSGRPVKIAPALITLAVIAGGISYLFYSSAGDAFEYYKHVDEVKADTARWTGKTLQMHGFVQPGSILRKIDKDKQQIEYKFTAINCGAVVEVDYAGTVPDTFKDRAEVVVKGKLVDGSHFVVSPDGITAKCPSKYSQTLDGPAATLCTKGDKTQEAAAPAPKQSAL